MGLNVAQFVEEHARRTPERTALSFEGRAVTYGALWAEATRLAAALGRLGLAAGDRLALLMANRPEWIVAYEGALVAGLVPVPINPLLAPPEIARILADSGARALIVDDERRQLAATALARIAEPPPLIGVETELRDLGRDAGPAEPVDTRPDTTAVLLYTSGTTGLPKGVELTHLNILWNAQAFALDLLRLGPEDVCCCVLPLAHAYAHSCILGPFLYAGAAIALLPRFEPEAVLRALASDRATVFMGVPAMFWALLHADPPPGLDLSSLRACVSGGQALPAEIHVRFEARFGVRISEGFGLSEATASVTGNRFVGVRKLRSAGLPYWGVRLRIVDDRGRPLPPGERGEIWVRGPNVMKGYFRNPEATAAAIRDGWLRTGDIGHLDEDGFLFVVDRKKEMIIRGGYNVYPREVEEVLYAHKDVLEAAVVGTPDARLGEEIVAYVVARPGAHPNAEALLEHCRSALAAYKLPRRVRFVDTLPKGTTGKIDKKAIQAWAAEIASS